MTKTKVFFYVQHLLGIGHAMRAALLCRAMSNAGLEVMLVNGGEPSTLDDPGLVDHIQLPPARAADPSFSGIVDAAGAPIDEAWKEKRRAVLLDCYENTQSDLLLVETFPFGRWPFRFEILPLLDLASGRGPILCSIRDILVPKSESKRNREILSIIQTKFDGVLVHGDETLVGLDQTYRHAKALEGRLHYTGYVAPGPDAPNQETDGEIIVSAGGGGTGEILINAAMKLARSSDGQNWRWRFLVGPNLPPDHGADLSAAPNITVESVRPDFCALLATAALSVSQAGYNTVMDVLVSKARNVLVPFGRFGQTEQPMRAKLLAEKGMSIAVEEETLTPQILFAAINRGLAMRRPNPAHIDLSGADTTARLVKQFMKPS